MTITAGIAGRSTRQALAPIVVLALGAVSWLSCGGGDSQTGPELPQIVIDSIRPDTATATLASTRIFIYGRHFVGGAQVLVNGSAHAATLNSPVQLWTLLNVVDLAQPDTLSVSVSAPGAITSGTLPFRVLPLPPAPVLLTISVDSVDAGTSLTLFATGQHIRTGTRILWDGVTLPSILFLDTTRVQGYLGTQLNVPGVHQVTLRTLPPGGGYSNTLLATSYAGRPRITGITPDSATAGRTDVTVTATGTEFYATSRIRFDGVDQPTTFNTFTGTLTATVTPAAITTPGSIPVTVFTPAPGGGTSDPLVFTSKVQPPVPTLTSLSVDSILAGETAQVYATGTGFVPGTTLHFGPVVRFTVWLADTLITAAYGSATGGTVQVTAVTQPPGGGTSNALPFTVTPLNVVPTITDFEPRFSVSTPDAGTLTILGIGFAPGAVVKWNDAPRSSTVVSDSRIDMALEAGDLAEIKDITVAVINPPPGGGGTAHTHYIIDSRTIDMKIVDFWSLDLLWDSTRQRIYASDATALRVVAFDPVAGTITGSVTTPAHASALRPSADWSRLYTASTPVQILTLSSFSLLGSWDIGQVSDGGMHFDASPKEPLTFAALVGSMVGLNYAVVATYTLAVRSTTESGPMRGPVAYDTSGTVVFGRSGLDSSLVRIFVPAGQPLGEEVQPHLGIWEDERWMKSAGDRLYSNRGRVIDVVTFTRLASIGQPGRMVRTVALDEARSRIYALELIPGNETELEHCVLVKYDMASLQYLDEQRIPTPCPPDYLPAGAAGFVRWGADGLAFRSAGVLLLRTSLID